MSSLLWKYFFENDVDSFRQVVSTILQNASAHNTRAGSKGGNNGHASSPGAALATSPTLTSKSPKQPTLTSRVSSHNNPPKSSVHGALSRAEINRRDIHGVTLLHYISSSYNEAASEFAIALLELPLLDLYIQDEESGWTALHRALYFGNITIARALMSRDIRDATELSHLGPSHGAGGLIKIKDREGNSPFDVYGASITSRNIRHSVGNPLLDGGQDNEDNDFDQGFPGDDDGENAMNGSVRPRVVIDGDELFAFGSNKNFTLGFGDEDDRQFPERIYLKRPAHLLRRFQYEHEARTYQSRELQPAEGPMSPVTEAQLPAAVRYRPIFIQDVQLSKMHSAVTTTDPEANLYMCGFGSGGRLGTGDETTRFGYVSIHGGGLSGKKIVHVGLGQNHTVVVSSDGETFTWGSNAYGQLGYAPSASGLKEEEPLQLLPRQVFGPLKREVVIGVAASRIHTVVHTTASLFTFGKNEGQLGLVDSDARSLTVQNTPRKVAASLFSSSILSVSAIDKATICLLENHDVWVFSNYGYTKMSFPLDGFSNYFLKSIWGPKNSSTENQICKITSGGDTICAMSSMGDVFTVHVTQKVEASAATGSTTNPSKIRGALSTPQRVWSLKKSHMAVRDVDVSQDGSVIICTESGSVWRRIKRAKIKDASGGGSLGYKAKDYKFSRVPGLTRIAAVRSNAFGSYAALRRDFDVLKAQVEIDSKSIWNNMFPLLPFHALADEDSDTEEPVPRFWASSQNHDVAAIRRTVLVSEDIEKQVSVALANQDSAKQAMYNVRIGTTTCDACIPVHDFVLGARSEVMRQALLSFREEYYFTIPEVFTIEYDSEGKTLVQFQGVDFITIFNLVLYLYTDSVADVWNHTRHAPAMAYRYRQVRNELIKVAAHMEMQKLEQAARIMQEPPKSLDKDFERVIFHPDYFDNGDVDVELDGGNVKVHSALVIQRCPFFEGLFEGRSAGLWLSSRREEREEKQDVIRVDLKHVDPEAFHYAVQHLYADTAEEMFDNTVKPDLDTFLDLIMDVMSVANELMLDRLAQSCQKVLGRYVNIRNICQLLNAVAPCSITQFKDAGLEYICLNLEGMLENKLLSELDDDLMLELDEVVRRNQLACLPISKSGRAEQELFEQHPELVASIARGKQAKVDSVALQTRPHDTDAKAISGSKAKAALLDDFDKSPSLKKSTSRQSQDRQIGPNSPSLKAKMSVPDLMFEMEDDEETIPGVKEGASTKKPHLPSTGFRESRLSSTSLSLDHVTRSQKADPPSEAHRSALAATPPSIYEPTGIDPGQHGKVDDGEKPWRSPTLPSSKLDMKSIMAQASQNRTSNLSASLSRQPQAGEALSPSQITKLSQRERKKQQQQQATAPKAHSPRSSEPNENQKQGKQPESPWQVASAGPKVSLKDVIGGKADTTQSNIGSMARTPSPMTLRQTVAGKAPSTRRAVTGPAQSTVTTPRRAVSTPTQHTQPASSENQPPSSSSTTQFPPIQSIRHITPSAEPTLQLSMTDILSQQQTEKEIIKEAAAKRSLQEIQEEQAFQEWWDEESRKVKEEAEGVASSSKSATKSERGVRSGRGVRGKSRGGSRGRGRGKGGAEGSSRGAENEVGGGSGGVGKKGVRDAQRGRKAS